MLGVERDMPPARTVSGSETELVAAMHRLRSLDALPTEVLAKIVEQVPFDKATFIAIRQINTRFQRLFNEYSASMTRAVAHSQYLCASTIYPLPSVAGIRQIPNVQWLVMLDHRTRTVGSIISLIVHAFLDHVVSPSYRSRWKLLVAAGLHLCYKLQDRETYAAKVAYVNSLSLLRLALIYIALVFSLRTAQQLGTGLMHRDHGPMNEEERMELCLCFEECTLLHGPDFLHSILTPSPVTHCHQCDVEVDGYAILENEYDAFDERQFGSAGATGLPRPTLISCLKREIAQKSSRTVEQVFRTVFATVQSQEMQSRKLSVVELVCLV